MSEAECKHGKFKYEECRSCELEEKDVQITTLEQELADHKENHNTVKWTELLNKRMDQIKELEQKVAELEEQLKSADNVLHWRHDNDWQSHKKIKDLEEKLKQVEERIKELKSWQMTPNNFNVIYEQEKQIAELTSELTYGEEAMKTVKTIINGELCSCPPQNIKGEKCLKHIISEILEEALTRLRVMREG